MLDHRERGFIRADLRSQCYYTRSISGTIMGQSQYPPLRRRNLYIKETSLSLD